jgi:hypothetical protein
MGKRKAKPKWSRKTKKSREGGPEGVQWESSAKDGERSNAKWEEYYKAQNIVPEEEWEAFKAAFLKDLPLSFRFTTINGTAQRLIQRFDDGEFGNDETVYDSEGYKFGRPTPIPWYPDKCGWTLDVSKKNLRKVEGLQKFRKFLIAVWSPFTLAHVCPQPTLLSCLPSGDGSG